MKYSKLLFCFVCIVIIIYYIQQPIKEGISFKEKCMVDGLKRNNIQINRDARINITKT